ncbi:hypothetical protein GWI33_009146 [Rhynchophorus ferrugineus]|uniref:ARID domain-containing protein n=1 Tax=Rhynchophorus ferrugineus TaxID=354439 RepID=A0A834IFV3_RHYFE|nr:hypothetical protein GWI33_009146 [Rhynchophorus ferrugineus]
MQVDDPPYLSVGTAVSAKYKGAFCEAKVSKVDRVVKCKVTFRMGLGTATVTDNDIKGTLRIGQQVQVKHPDRRDMVEATITKIQDCSQYTVVFDDGDITTLRRTALCLKSGRHFNESETLDQLPLTHPEHFGNPVVGGRRGRRNRQLKDESSDEDIEEENEPDLEGYTQDIGRVVSIETVENKRGKEKWFPGLIVIPSAQPTVKINVKDEFLIRSFRDDRYYTVPKKEVNEFNREQAEKVDSAGLQEAIQKAIKFLDNNELPLHWEKSSLFNLSVNSDSYDNASESSEEEQSEEKDRFVAQLYKFMDDSGTPLNKTPAISNKDIDLHRLFRVVHKLGGYNRVTNQSKWKSVTGKMRLVVNQNISNQVKSVYKKCLLSYESFHRTLGVTMFNPTRSKKSKGRSLIRDKDRTPISSPRPEREEDSVDKQIHKKETPPTEKTETKIKRKTESKEKEDSGRKSKLGEMSDAGSDISEVAGTSGVRPKRNESKQTKEKPPKQQQGEKAKVAVSEKVEDVTKKDDKIQNTRSKSTPPVKVKESPKEPAGSSRQTKDPITPVKAPSKPIKKPTTKEEEEKDKKPKQRKKPPNDLDKVHVETGSTSSSSSSSSSSSNSSDNQIISANIGHKVIIYYGPTNESKVTYEAKVVDIDREQSEIMYLVHYTGWNTRYDEWIPGTRIAENLSSGVRLKRTKIPVAVNVKSASSNSGLSATGSKQSGAKRNRLMSVSSKAPSEEKPPRSTTPSSITSNSSRTKSPATPATRASRLAARQESSKNRRISAQTDASAHSDSDSESSSSDSEMPRTRSGSLKTEEPEIKVYKKKVSKPPSMPGSFKGEKRKEKGQDEDTEREDELEKTIKERKIKKVKRTSERSADESDEDSASHPKGRDFDLNQIRSELKGFSKAIKIPQVEMDKDSVSSSDDSSSNTNIVIKEEKEEIKTEESAKAKSPHLPSPKLEKSSSSEDIYEFKEPEPFEFESRSKLGDEKNSKKRLRIFQDLEKSPRKRGGKSPLSCEKMDSKLDHPEPKTYSRIPKPVRISDDEEDDLNEEAMEEEPATLEVKKEDPFDKLIESPSFNIVKTSPEKPIEEDPVLSRRFFTSRRKYETTETSDDSRDVSTSNIEAGSKEPDLRLSGNPQAAATLTLGVEFFESSESNTSDLEFPNSKTTECKGSNSDDEIQAQIHRVIEQNSLSDDDSNDEMLNIEVAPVPSIQAEDSKKPLTILGIPATSVSPKEPVIRPKTPAKVVMELPVVIEKKEPETIRAESPPETKPSSPKKPIDPALQETDSSLLESIVSKPPLILNPKLDDTGKELAVKTRTRIADSILQKFNSIKNSFETKVVKGESSAMLEAEDAMVVEPDLEKPEVVVVTTDDPETGVIVESKPKFSLDMAISLPDIVKPREDVEVGETKGKPLDLKPKEESPKVESPDVKRRRRVISKQYIDDSDTDSSDCDNLVIARSDDEETRTDSSDNKPLIDCKENTDSNLSLQKTITTDESQPEQEKRSFNFDEIKLKKETFEEPKESVAKEDPEPPVKEAEIEIEIESKEEEIKDDQDPNLHSLLLCEEELPRSPAPAPEQPNSSDIPSAANTIHEMPFASAPGSSNSKMLLEQKKVLPAAVVIPGERNNRSDAQAVIENIPPTTPESTRSNLSPRGDNDNISPNSNDSSKSNDAENEYRTERRNSAIKVSTYSEEDTQIGADLQFNQKAGGDSCAPPASCRKRRRSLRTPEEAATAPQVPAKRGRKPLANRQRRDSDSDDASENSAPGNNAHTPGMTTGSSYDRTAKSPRPSKYNFFVEFDPSLDSAQRIAIIQQKLTELRKTYADVKAELAIVERRRKKIRRKEREALKSAKQEMACA